MASYTLSSSQQLPDGTSVSVYPRSARSPQGLAPTGTAVTSGSMSGGSVTFTGLTLGTPYTAYALVSSEHRYVDFTLSKADIAAKREVQSGVVVMEATIDLASIGANTTTDVNVALPSGSAKAGDIATAVFFPALNNGLVIQGAGIVAADNLRLRVSNLTAGALDAASASVTFVIIKAA